jgi:acetyl/propionyl-CoA carboxylase alpha subunit
VELQIRTVAERHLPFAQSDLAPARGVAVQARLYAEDAAQDFLPCTGRVEIFEAAPGVRTDAGVAAGCDITSHYDPMIAKVIAHGGDRQQALALLREALAQTTVLGVTSNRAFLLALLAQQQVQANAVHTEFIDGWLAARGRVEEPKEHVAAAMALWLAHRRVAPSSGAGSWYDASLTGWRMSRGDLQPTPGAPALTATYQVASATGKWKVGFGIGGGSRFAVQVGDTLFRVEAPDATSSEWQTVSIDGRALRLRSHCTAESANAFLGEEQIALDVRPLHDESAGGGGAGQGQVRAPMMGLVIGVSVQAGQQVAAGQRLATMESMKMEMAINAPYAGTVAWVGCAAQARVERHQDLFHIAPAA